MSIRNVPAVVAGTAAVTALSNSLEIKCLLLRQPLLDTICIDAPASSYLESRYPFLAAAGRPLLSPLRDCSRRVAEPFGDLIGIEVLLFWRQHYRAPFTVLIAILGSF